VSPFTTKSFKPLLLYDGDCRFCCLWVARWREKARSEIVFASSQSGAGEGCGFSATAPLEAVQLVEASGEIRSGAAAVFRLLALSGGLLGGLLWWIYGISILFRAISERAYRLVADHRPLFTALTRIFWGSDVREPSYGKATRLFLRLLGLVFASAFAGLWWQIEGLIGPHGILPAGEFLSQVQSALGGDVYRAVPTLFWITGCSVEALHGVCAAGTVLSVALLLAVPFRWQGFVILFLEMLYLSLVNVGQIFMGYQWDALLLETGFLALFLAPWPWMSAWPGTLSRLSRWLLLWLLFRLMVSSALVKWNSGDPAWRDLTALDYHFWTQPLPNPGGWLAAQLPEFLLRLMTLAMLLIEFGAPWLLIGPRNLRLLGAGVIVLLQVLITLTGNYGFFNLLTISLCLLAVDDCSWPSCLLTPMNSDAERKPEPCFPKDFQKRTALPRVAIVIGAMAFFLLSVETLPLRSIPRPALLSGVLEAIAPLHLVNCYGLFAVMTKQRNEIIFEGSDDGLVWRSYNFRFKLGNPRQIPPMIPLLMPRLDWQMWFAALGPVESSPWLGGFVLRLLQGEPAVLHLLGENPFSGNPPRYLRARLEEARCSTPLELFRQGLWWEMKSDGEYFPRLELRHP
jgi:predicted DCC family thiol-disulfide oxidoreductase YuxK